jgi:hypothetical protein
METPMRSGASAEAWRLLQLKMQQVESWPGCAVAIDDAAVRAHLEKRRQHFPVSMAEY